MTARPESREELRERYACEKRLAARIRAAAPQAREAVVAEAYAAFFEAYPDAALCEGRMGATHHKERFLKRLLADCRRILEVGCGHGRTLRSLMAPGRELCGLDTVLPPEITEGAPIEGLQFRRCSGVRFTIDGACYDAAFSIDVLEHLHPDDALAHFACVFEALVPGGRYVVMTPHAAVGPHDISAAFDATPTGFHLQEYTYALLRDVAGRAGFEEPRTSRWPFRCYGSASGARPSLMPLAVRVAMERGVSWLPRSKSKRLLFKVLGLYTVCGIFRRPG